MRIAFMVFIVPGPAELARAALTDSAVISDPFFGSSIAGAAIRRYMFSDCRPVRWRCSTRQSGLEDVARLRVDAIGAPVDLGHAPEHEIDQPRGEPRLANISLH